MPRVRRVALRRRTVADRLLDALGDTRGAERVRRFFETCLVHSNGEWAGRPFILERWQWEHIIQPLFGTLQADGRRQYRHGLITIPRKSGKTTLAAGIALYMLFADEEAGGQIYLAAASRDQAAICFREAAHMVQASPILKERSALSRAQKRITDLKSNSFLRAISSDAYNAHGLNPHAVILDEIAQQPNRELYDVLATSMGARRQPLMLSIGTAGWNRHSVAFELYELAKRIERGTAEDSRFFGYVREADETDDWTDEATWRKANPSLGTFRKIDELRDMCERAMLVPSLQNSFRNLYLNQWVQQETRWLDMHAWDACAADVADEQLAGVTCFGGLDVSSTIDVTAFVLAFPMGERIAFRCWFWIPSDNIRDRETRDKVPYFEWIRKRLVEATPGNVIDVRIVTERIKEICQRYRVRDVSFDRWGAAPIVAELNGAGISVVQMGQGYASMSAPTKHFQELILQNRVCHGANPVLRWMADCLTVDQDPAGNIKPVKPERSHGKHIDGMVAAIMALDGFMRRGRPVNTSIQWWS